jgi:hypothetical protein
LAPSGAIGNSISENLLKEDYSMIAFTSFQEKSMTRTQIK